MEVVAKEVLFLAQLLWREEAAVNWEATERYPTLEDPFPIVVVVAAAVVGSNMMVMIHKVVPFSLSCFLWRQSKIKGPRIFCERLNQNPKKMKMSTCSSP